MSEHRIENLYDWDGLEEEIVKYIKSLSSLPAEFGGRVGREGDNMDLSNYEQPFILVQVLFPETEIHSLGDWARDLDFSVQINIFN